MQGIKMSDDIIVKIRTLIGEGVSVSEAARITGVSRTSVRRYAKAAEEETTAADDNEMKGDNTVNVIPKPDNIISHNGGDVNTFDEKKALFSREEMLEEVVAACRDKEHSLTEKIAALAAERDMLMRFIAEYSTEENK